MSFLRWLYLFTNFLEPLVPFLVGLFYWRKMPAAWHLLVAVFGCAFLVEFFRFFQLLNYYAKLNLPWGLSVLGYNLYVLAISILYTLLFEKWGLFTRYKKLPGLIILLFVIIWILDHFVWMGYRIHDSTKIFRIFYSFFLSIFAIQQINHLVVNEKGKLLKNSIFLVCLCLLFFFVPYIITEAVFLIRRGNSFEFTQAIYLFRIITNPVIYFIFTLAVLWTPQKKHFIQLS